MGGISHKANQRQEDATHRIFGERCHSICFRRWIRGTSGLLSEKEAGRLAEGRERGGVPGKPPSLCARFGTINSPRAVARRDSVLDCGKTEQQIGVCACAPRPLPLFLACTGWESARGLGNQNCSLRGALAGKQSKEIFLKDFSPAPVPTTESEPLVPKETI